MASDPFAVELGEFDEDEETIRTPTTPSKGTSILPSASSPFAAELGEFDEDEETPLRTRPSARPFSPRRPLSADPFERSMVQASEFRKDTQQLIRDSNDDVMMGSLKTIGPNDDFEFEGETGVRAAVLHQDYIQNDPERALMAADPTLASPEEDEEDWSAGDMLMNTANFLFSDEIALLGMKWDEEGFDWDVQHLRNQLVEHPYSTAFTVASYAIPGLLAWRKGARIAERATQLSAKAGGEAGVAAGRGFLGGKLGYKFDEHAKLVQTLAKPEANDGARFFSDNVADALTKARTPDEIADIVSPSELNRLLIGNFHDANYLKLKALADEGKLETIQQKAAWKMWNSFGNKYARNLTDVSKHHITSMDDLFKKAQIGRFMAQAPTRLGRAGEEEIYKFMMGVGSKKKLATKVGQENAEWASHLSKEWTGLFEEQFAEGFIDDATYALFSKKKGATGIRSGHHLPAVLEGTPDFENVAGRVTKAGVDAYGGYAGTTGMDVAKALTGPTTLGRTEMVTRKKTLARLGELDVNPKRMTMGGYVKDNVVFQIHRNFRDLILDSVENTGKYSGHLTTTRASYDSMGTVAQRNWMNFDELEGVIPGLSVKMKRMMAAEIKAKGLDPKKYADMPLVNKEVVKQFFGRDNSAHQAAGIYQKFFELLTSVHKTSRTALNPATHMSNIVGNMMFIGMAGANPFSRQMLSDGKAFSRAYGQIAKQVRAKGDKAMSIDEIMSKENFGAILGDNRYITDKLGNKIDQAELFTTPAMRELLDEQAFANVEGFASIGKTLQAMEKISGDHIGGAAVEKAARVIAGIGESKALKPTLERASSAYLAEDIVPKMMYAAHLARKGWGQDAIIREIGRRLPQYLTVGNLPAKSRSLVLPWITFTSEATRIMKNNMMDLPVQTMAWMQAPAITQSVVSGLGLGPNFKDAEAMMDMAPHWADRYQTVMVNGEDSSEMLGAVGGGAVGAVAGTVMGGAVGAALGGAVGAAVGGGIGAMAEEETPQNELRKFNRAWTLDFLPQSAMMPASMAPHMWEQALPQFMGGAPATGQTQMRAIKDLLPVEPLATFMPMFDVMTGRGSFGEEISTKGGIDYAGKMAIGLMGHLSPPIMQKWGMKIQGEQVNPLDMADIWEANGGQLSVPQKLTATFGGIAAAGLTFMGTRDPKSAAAAGLFGAAAGSQINVKKLLIDFGIEKNPYSDEFANWTLDGIANSFFGVSKSWKANTPQWAANTEFRNKRFDEIRTAAAKNLRDAVSAGRPGKMRQAESQVEAINRAQYRNVRDSDRKTNEWRERQVKAMMKSPAWRGWSDEELQIKISSLRSAQQAKYSQHADKILQAIIEEQRQRAVSKLSGLKLVE